MTTIVASASFNEASVSGAPPVSLIDQKLPVEIMIQIFRLTDTKARCRSCQINKRWKHLLYDSPDLWQFLDLSNRHTLGGDKFFDIQTTANNAT
ncbi:hypothetical protein HDU76_009719, partial [Blyttiomyces sp. JEL0837]